ncbi:MAG: helix-turn-helix transcriptional regulator [Moraxella sp.]|nr:helix-turn-helix transcriptional regulator [Moraxella sp.]
MKPNAQTSYNPDPDYLRELIAKTGLTQKAVAELVGVSPRMMRSYLTFTDNTTYQKAPYAVQFAIECLASP